MRYFLFLAPFVFFLNGCIGDDFLYDYVAPTIRITNAVDSLKVNSSHQFGYMYFNNVGVEEMVENVMWLSSDPNVISINDAGFAETLQLGQANISVQYHNGESLVQDMKTIVVDENATGNPNLRSGFIASTSSYELTGKFELTKDINQRLHLTFFQDYHASSSLPGLYIYLSNNPNTITNAYEIGRVQVFSGAHEYLIQNLNIGLDDYKYVLYFCKPFNVKVGDGQIN